MMSLHFGCVGSKGEDLKIISHVAGPGSGAAGERFCRFASSLPLLLGHLSIDPWEPYETGFQSNREVISYLERKKFGSENFWA